MTTTARKYESSAWVYIKSEPGLWTVGFYEPSDKRKWQPESDHTSEESAAKRVHYLNGGGHQAELEDREIGTILAALRHWQETGNSRDPKWDQFFETGSALSREEIDRLCEKINLGGAA